MTKINELTSNKSPILHVELTQFQLHIKLKKVLKCGFSVSSINIVQSLYI